MNLTMLMLVTTMPKKSADRNSPYFKSSEWEKRQRWYWQPVLYFNTNPKKRVDFCISAKNACSTVKVFYTWNINKNLDTLYDDKYYEFYKDWAKKRNIPLEDLEVDPKVFVNYGFQNHHNTRRDCRVKLWRNQNTDMKTFFRTRSVRFAIKRDPIKRFLSSYTHTHRATAPAWHGDHEYSIDDMIEHLKDGTYWNEHLESQTFWMGEPSWYNYIYGIDDTKKCLKHMASILEEKEEIPDFHFMKNPNEKPALTRDQISKIEQYYIEDYENGWCY